MKRQHSPEGCPQRKIHKMYLSTTETGNAESGNYRKSTKMYVLLFSGMLHVKPTLQLGEIRLPAVQMTSDPPQLAVETTNVSRNRSSKP